MHSTPVATRRLSISCNRALVLDSLHFSRQVPLFPVEREFNLAEVARLRSRQRPRISWPALFLKAYAVVAARHPPLRQAYLRWPWPRLVETSHSVAMVAINRQYLDENRLCWGRFEQPDRQSLRSIQNRLQRYQTEPVEEVFAKQVRLSKLPGWLRRMLFWWNLNLGGDLRATRLGTFSLSTLAGLGALNRAHPSFLTTSLTFGPVNEQGQALVTLLCDHRVLDGALAAQALAELETTLRGQIAGELANQSLKIAG